MIVADNHFKCGLLIQPEHANELRRISVCTAKCVILSLRSHGTLYETIMK